jgi:hypothetical protein
MAQNILIHDGNYQDFIGDRHIHRDHNGVDRLLLPPGSLVRYEGRKYGQIPGLPTFASQIPVIPRSQWSARCQALTGHTLSARIRNNKQPIAPLDQDGENFCWRYGPTGAMEVCRTIRQGDPFIRLAPESLAGQTDGVLPNVGGDPMDALQHASDDGACAQWFLPGYNDRQPGTWQSGWLQDRGNHRVQHTLDIGTFDELATALLMCIPVVVWYDWWGHCIYATDLVTSSDGRWAIKIRNSWGNWGDDGFADIEENRADPSNGGACAVLEVTPCEKVYAAQMVARQAA